MLISGASKQISFAIFRFSEMFFWFVSGYGVDYKDIKSAELGCHGAL